MLALLLICAFSDVRIDAASPAAARALARERLSVYRIEGSSAFAVAEDSTIEALRLRGFVVISLAESPRRDAVYRSPEEINAAIEALADGNLVKLERLGVSHNGLPILALRIGDPSLPNVRVLGGHHGDEAPSVEVPLRWITDLLARRSETAIAAVLARTSLLVAPMVNPDGYGAHSRYNAKSVDLNRNYGFGFRTSEFGAGEHAYSEPEVRAVVLDNEWHRYGVSLTYHTGAENVGYPFNYTTLPMASDERFLGYAKGYKDFVSSPQFYVTRGSEWFISYGDANDYSLGYFGGSDFTVEMSNNKTPPASALDALTAEHGAAATHWLSLADHTVRVEVRDAESNEPLPAQVSTLDLVGHCDPIGGSVQLQALLGSALEVSFPGYVTQSVATVFAAPLSVKLKRQNSATRVRVTSGFDFTGAIEVDADTSELVGIRPGAEDVRFTCEDRVCTASAFAARRPGYYTLVATLLDGAVVSTPNAFYIADPFATGDLLSAVLEGDLIRLSTPVVNAAWVEHGGAAGLLSTSMPTSGPALDVMYVLNGALYRVPLVMESDEQPVPVPAEQAPKGCRGCQQSDGGIWVLILVFARHFWLVRRDNTRYYPQ